MRFENEFIGLTVKEILVDKLGFSKRAVTALKSRPDGILINGAHVTVRAVVKQGDVLEINIGDPSSNNEKLVPSEVVPDIVYEDEYIVAVNKPPFMPTHQSQGHFYDTLAMPDITTEWIAPLFFDRQTDLIATQAVLFLSQRTEFPRPFSLRK